MGILRRDGDMRGVVSGQWRTGLDREEQRWGEQSVKGFLLDSRPSYYGPVSNLWEHIL